MIREIFIVKNNTGNDVEIKTFGVIVPPDATVELGKYDDSVLSDELFTLLSGGTLTRIIDNVPVADPSKTYSISNNATNTVDKTVYDTFTGITNGNIESISTSLSSEISSTNVEITSLSVTISGNTSNLKIDSLSVSLSTEISDRTSSDFSISNSLFNEVYTRNSTDESLSTSLDTKYSRTGGVIDGSVTIVGDLLVSGTTITVDTEYVLVEDNYMTLNYGEPGSGVTRQTAGIVVDRGSLTDYLFEFSEGSGTFRVGQSGDTQAVATREDNPIDKGFAVWDSSMTRFVTDVSPPIITSLSTSVSNEVSSRTSVDSSISSVVSGNISNFNTYTAITAPSSFVLKTTFNSFTGITNNGISSLSSSLSSEISNSIVGDSSLSTSLSTEMSTRLSVDTSLSFAVVEPWVDINRIGFVDNTQTSISFNDTTYVFTLSAMTSTWSYYRAGVKCTITGSKTVTLPGTPPAPGAYYITINSTDGNLLSGTSTWTLADDTLPIATIRWNDASNPKYFLSEERHTALIDSQIHRYLHDTRGTQFITGGGLIGPDLQTATNPGNTFGINQTTIADEDLYLVLPGFNRPNGTTLDYNILYRTSPTTWTWQLSEVPYKYTETGYIEYDNNGIMTVGLQNRYYNTYLLFTNLNSVGRYSIIPGRGSFSSLADAQAEIISNFDFTGIPVAESVIAYQFTWNTSNSYNNKGKCYLAVKPVKINVAATTTVESGAGIDHNTLAGMQGGSATERYHLTSATYVVVTGISATISTETSVRTSVDSSLSSVLSTELSTRNSSDLSLSSGLSTEVSTRGSSDTSLSIGLSTGLSTMVGVDSSLSTSILNEISIRNSSDLSLSNSISNLNTVDSSLSTSILNEISTRTSKDSSLSTMLSTEISTRSSIDSSLSYAVALGGGTGTTSLSSALSTEISTRSSADEYLLYVISLGGGTGTTSLSSAMLDEISDRISGDTSLSSALSTEISTRLSVDSYLSYVISLGGGTGTTSLSSAMLAEISNRISGDISLNTIISNTTSSEISTRSSVDSSLSAKISLVESTRISVDSSLSTSITGITSLSSVVSTEISTRTSVDSSLSTNISTNISIRTSVDLSLSSGLSTELSTRNSADLSLSTSIRNEVSTRTSVDTSLSNSVSSLSIDYYFISLSGSVTTTTNTYITMPNMIFTGVTAGVYFLSFGTPFTHSTASAFIYTSIYISGNSVNNSELMWGRGGSQGNITTLHGYSNFLINLSTTSNIEIRWRTSAATASAGPNGYMSMFKASGLRP